MSESGTARELDLGAGRVTRSAHALRASRWCGHRLAWMFPAWYPALALAAE